MTRNRILIEEDVKFIFQMSTDHLRLTNSSAGPSQCRKQGSPELARSSMLGPRHRLLHYQLQT